LSLPLVVVAVVVAETHLKLQLVSAAAVDGEGIIR